MDPDQLTNLVKESSKKLANLHEQLGSSPSAVSASIEALGDALRKAVDDQLEKCQKEVDQIRQQCADDQDKIRQFNRALLEEGQEDGEKEILDENMPLLQKQALLKSKHLHLEAQHSQRLTEFNSIKSELESYRPVLGSRVELPSPRRASTKGKSKATDPIQFLPSYYLQTLRDLNANCLKEVEERTNYLGSVLGEIVGLWTELQDPPTGINPQNSHSTDVFQESILNSLGLKPIFSIISSSPPPSKAKTDQSQSEVEYIFEGFKDGNDNKEEDGDESSSSNVQDLLPTDENVAKANELKDSLEEIRTQREARIQDLYDELETLWVMCDVPAAEIDEWVHDHRGSAKATVEAYEAELMAMQAHKAKFLETYIENCRETIQELWSKLHITPEEQSRLFPELTVKISDLSSEEDRDSIQTCHEEYISTLKAEYQLKEKLFKKMSQWRLVKDEEEQLKISEKDPNRYKNAKAGDMLKEEKARKRIKVLKPKLEETLRREIGNWENETAREFTYDGVRLLDVLGVEEKPLPAGSKRSRTASNSTDTSVLSASTNSRASSRAAPTPLRGARGGVPATPLEGSVAKKQRTASGSVIPSSSVRRTGGGSAAPPVSGMGAKSRLGSHQQPLQTPSFQTPTPRNYNHSMNQSSPSRLPQPKRFASNASTLSVSSTSGSLKFAASSNAKPLPTKNKSFRPRPSQIHSSRLNQAASSSDSSEPEFKKSKIKARLSLNKFREALIGPGDIQNGDNKWSDVGNHRWPTTNDKDKDTEFARSSSSASDATTVIHSTDPNLKKSMKKRGPSMSLEAGLAMMANKSSSGMPTIRHVSSESLNEKLSKGGGNWAVLDDESEIMDGVMEFNEDDDDDAQDAETRNAGFGNERIEEENESLMF